MVPRAVVLGKQPRFERNSCVWRMTCDEHPSVVLRLGRAALAAAAVAFIGACGAAAPSANPSPRTDPAASAAASVSPSQDPIAADLDRLLATLETTHPEPFHGISRNEFVAALDAYEEQLPDLDGPQAVVGLMRVVAMLSREGRDGHQFALPRPGHEGAVLPLRIYEFAEGVYVTDAVPPNTDLLGARITAIDGTAIDEVLAAVEPLVPRDGPATVPAFRPVLLLRIDVLRGLGVIGDGTVEVSAVDADGGEVTASLEPIGFDDYVAWAGDFGMLRLPADDRMRYLADPRPLTVTAIDETTVYVRYRNVIPPDLADARELLGSARVDRLVLDLRQNPGGDNSTSAPLLSLVQEFAADHPGGLIVLTDRVTFSAAANLATQVEQSTDATFIGEAMGGGLNFWDDVRWVGLDALPVPMQVGVSTRYWQFATADDPRLTIAPDIVVPLTAAEHFAGLDPALDAALGQR